MILIVAIVIIFVGDSFKILIIYQAIVSIHSLFCSTHALVDIRQPRMWLRHLQLRPLLLAFLTSVNIIEAITITTTKLSPLIT